MTTPATGDSAAPDGSPVWEAWAHGVTTPPPGPGPVAATPAVRAWPAPPPNPSPRWARVAILALLALTALLYLWSLDINGWANSYYSAAAQAAGDSWTAWFFGSLDAANSITVDKTPASLWLMGLSVRLFGLSSWSILVPQALLGVASVGVLYATVRRWFGAPAGLIAGAVLALTPVATLMFRFNNPDALLVFLLLCAAWAMGRATERGSMRWILLAGGLVGSAFLAKMLQAFLVLPGFVAMYAVAAPIDWRRRIGHLLAAFAAMVVGGGWWVAIVELWPASARPYIGGSQTSSVLELMVGYNGLGRLTGDETGSVVPGGGTGQGGIWGQTGWNRLLSASYGGQIAWLLPAAVAMIGVLLWVSRRGPRTDLTRAAALGWGGWLLVTAAVISFGAGIIHEYYTVALAPAIGALVGVGAMALWAQRERLWARVVSAALVIGSAWWAAVLLGRSADFVPWLRGLILVGGLATAGLLLITPLVPARLRRGLGAGAGLGALLVLLAGPAAYSAQTATNPATGSLPSAGPSVSGGRSGPGGARGGGLPGGQNGPGRLGPGQPGTRPAPPGGSLAVPGGGSLLPQPNQEGTTGLAPNQDGTTATGPAAASGPGGAGSLLEGSTPGEALTEALLADADNYTWVAATVGANSAAAYQLATQRPVMAIGGFNGSDPAPTLAQFQDYIAEGRIHHFISSGGRGGFGAQIGGSQAASAITAWVSESFTATTIDGVTVYDLTSPSMT
jgi:4-amino-4-deoxy-L-arabinose transferase-like glycosyltransferase